MNALLKVGRFAFFCFGVVITVPILYLAAAQIGSFVQVDHVERASASQQREHSIYLINNPIHTDIAFEVTPQLRAHFRFLNDSSLPMEHENLRYLAFGWGSEAFYTTAGTYQDIQVSAVMKAIIGDNAVMRVTAFGDVSTAAGISKISITNTQLEGMFKSINNSFLENVPKQMAGITIGSHDAFYPAKGHFNIFNPCNQWVNRVLNTNGIEIGVWTPTTQALNQSLRYFHSH